MISVLYNIILITNFKLIEMCIKSSRMERGVNTEIPLRFLRMLSSLSPIISRPIGVTSHTTPLSIRRGAGGEALLFFLLPQPFFPPFLAHSPYFS